jgi:hypothetical protein
MTFFLFAKLLNGFVHAYLYNFGILQISILLLINFILLIISIKFNQMYSSNFINRIQIFQYILRVVLHIFFLVE